MDIGIAPCTEGALMVHQDLSGRPADQKAELGLDKNRKKKGKKKSLNLPSTAECELTRGGGEQLSAELDKVLD